MASEAPDKKETILLVEDEEDFRAFLFKLLSDHGYNVLVANDVEQALRQSREFKSKIHLLVSNIKLGEESGIELGTRIQITRPDIKVMLVSGFSFGTLVLDHGWQFLPKPFVPDMLMRLIENLLIDPRAQGTPDVGTAD
jgi:DNA-binding NtrC family response regulator